MIIGIPHRAISSPVWVNRIGPPLDGLIAQMASFVVGSIGTPFLKTHVSLEPKTAGTTKLQFYWGNMGKSSTSGLRVFDHEPINLDSWHTWYDCSSDTTLLIPVKSESKPESIWLHLKMTEVVETVFW